MRPFDLEHVMDCLDVHVETPGLRYAAKNFELEYRRVFGGQLLAQFVRVAAAATPGKDVKSMSVLFPREGHPDHPITYTTNTVQDGRTFASLAITACQGDRVIATALVSLHLPEVGLERQDDMPDLGGPDAATPFPNTMIPWELRTVDGVDLLSREVGPATYAMWMRAPGAPDELSLNQALLAHGTDMTLIGTALRPFPELSQADTMVKFHSAVTSHTMWFHRPFQLANWTLIQQQSPIATAGRTFGRGDVYTQDGTLVASFAQEAMVRMYPPSP